jgi:hypothetical protein
MSNKDQCSCIAPQWLEWENQMEPGEQCSYCQKREYEDSLSHQEVLSPRMQRLTFELELEHAFKLKERARLKEKLKQIDKDELPF